MLHQLLREQYEKDLGGAEPVALPIHTRKALEMYLNLFAIDREHWSPEKFEELWTEIDSRETVLVQHGKQLVRYIRTLTIRIYHDLPGDDSVLPNDRRVFLSETINFKDGRPSKRRPHANSLSEKLFWHEDAKEEEGAWTVIKRAIKDELTKKSTGLPVELTDEDRLCFWRDPSQKIVVDVPRHPSGKFPGPPGDSPEGRLLTRNELYPYIGILRDCHYDPAGYVEERPDRVHDFTWDPPGGMRKH